MLQARRLVLLGLIFLVGCTIQVEPQSFSAAKTEEEKTTLVETLKTEQETSKTNTGEYEQKFERVDGNIQYETYVHDGPEGKEYSVVLEETRDDGIYRKIFRNGIDDGRNWILINFFGSASTTSK